MLTMSTSLTSTSNPAKSTQKRHVTGLTGAALEDGFTRSGLQVVHANGAEYKRRYRQFLFQFIEELLTELEMEVDFSLSFEDVLAAGDYDYEYIAPGFTAANLPVSGFTGKQLVKVGLNKRKSATTNQEWLDYLKGLGQPFVHPLLLLALGAKHPDKQRETPLFTLWFDEGGRLWYLYLGGDAGERGVGVDRSGLGDDWFDFCLAVSARK